MNRLSFTWVKHHLQRGVLSSSLVSKGLHTGQQRAGVYTSQTLPRPLRVNSLYLSQRTVFSRIRESLSNRIDDQRTKQEEAQKDNLLKGLMDLDLDQRYSMHIYKKQLETALKEGTSGWRSMIPGMKEHVGLPEVQSMLTITEVMTPTELDNHRVIRQRELKRISQKSGQPVEKVQSLLNQFNMVQMIDKWIKIRRKSNAPVPESMDEILTLMLTDRRGLPVSEPRWLQKSQNRLAAIRERRTLAFETGKKRPRHPYTKKKSTIKRFKKRSAPKSSQVL